MWTIILITFILLPIIAFKIVVEAKKTIVRKEQERLQKIIHYAIILDVRTMSEFNNDHIDGALNISLGELRSRHWELDVNQHYITYCSHGLRSTKAKKILESNGFKKVYNGGTIQQLEMLLCIQKDGTNG